MKLVIHIDGGARGNPGPAGAGVVIRTEGGEPILEAGYFLGRVTNNVAEYTALLKALEAAVTRGGTSLLIHSDSELLVRQINGEYRVKNPGLQPLFDEAMGRLRRLTSWKVQHVRREFNARADELANLAMDVGEDVIECEALARPAELKASRPVPSEGNEEAPTFLVRCTTPPANDVCPAPCAKGITYEFSKTTPAGLCLRAADEVIKRIVAMEGRPESIKAVCAKEGCGAKFTISIKA